MNLRPVGVDRVLDRRAFCSSPFVFLGAKGRRGPRRPRRDSPGSPWSHETGLLQDWDHRRSPYHHCHTGNTHTHTHTHSVMCVASAEACQVRSCLRWYAATNARPNMHRHKRVMAGLSFMICPASRLGCWETKDTEMFRSSLRVQLLKENLCP